MVKIGDFQNFTYLVISVGTNAHGLQLQDEMGQETEMQILR